MGLSGGSDRPVWRSASEHSVSPWRSSQTQSVICSPADSSGFVAARIEDRLTVSSLTTPRPRHRSPPCRSPAGTDDRKPCGSPLECWSVSPSGLSSSSWGSTEPGLPPPQPNHPRCLAPRDHPRACGRPLLVGDAVGADWSCSGSTRARGGYANATAPEVDRDTDQDRRCADLTSWHLPSRHRPCGRCPRVSASDQISARELSSCLAGWLIARRSACWTWSAPRSTSPIINFGQWRRDRVQLHLTTPSRVENQPMSCAMVRRGIDRSPATARACLRSSQQPSSVTRYALCQPA